MTRYSAAAVARLDDLPAVLSATDLVCVAGDADAIPFDLPAEITVSLRGVSNERESWRLQDARAMVKLVKANW